MYSALGRRVARHCATAPLVQFLSKQRTSCSISCFARSFELSPLPQTTLSLKGHRRDLHLRSYTANSSVRQGNCNMSKSALVILAPGAEEMEFTIAADVLRRAGIVVTVAGLNGSEPVKCSRDVVIVPDKSLDQALNQTYDVIVLPGGLGGSNAMGESKAIGDLLRTQESSGRLIAAICAAPTALAKHGIATGKSLTSYPAMKPQLVDKYSYVDDKNVVQDGNLITSRGPGTAYEFALKISEQLAGAEKAQEVAKGLLLTFN